MAVLSVATNANLTHLPGGAPLLAPVVSLSGPVTTGPSLPKSVALNAGMGPTLPMTAVAVLSGPTNTAGVAVSGPTGATVSLSGPPPGQ